MGSALIRKKGISPRQLQRTLGVGMKTAWHMGHRIRLAMATSADAGPIGGEGKTVEADEAYLAKSPKTRKSGEKHARTEPVVLSLVERGGAIRSMFLDDKNVRSALVQHLDDRSRLVTDGSTVYKGQSEKHESVDHSKYEWARGDVHTNSIESFWSQVKRGINGTYVWVSKKHLQLYLREFEYRHNLRRQPALMFELLLQAFPKVRVE